MHILRATSNQIKDEAERLFRMCDLNSDKIVTKEELRLKMNDNVDFAEALGLHYDVRDNLVRERARERQRAK
jgi:hypothetical protein